jgi:hypothetical protein
MMKVFQKSELEIYKIEDYEDIIATSEEPGFDDDLNGEWV